ncbi:MAG: RNA 2',3'-cyclic phosphodiesterase [Flavobacteriales bacterium]|nr:RNA 2',3'-cyclic phosphodiesterase [Bacteroidales bacterium AH-315-I05]PCJ88790.1 MAG: RNA 2',3'-cyclic phosphodiesterase [Flavobacteriales bacterium]
MKKRLFVGIPVPKQLASELSQIQKQNTSVANTRWTPKENLHITVYFIGNGFENEITTKIQRIAAKNTISELLLKDICLFPEKNPRMIWARFETNKLFSELCLSISNIIHPHKATEWELIPHITLARFKNISNPSFNLETSISNSIIQVEKLVLWESVQQLRGAKYIPLKSLDLKSKS